MCWGEEIPTVLSLVGPKMQDLAKQKKMDVMWMETVIAKQAHSARYSGLE